MSTNWLQKRRMLPLLALAGVILLSTINHFSSELAHNPTEVHKPLVSSLTLTPYQAMPRAIGYGRAVPTIDFQEKSEISGRVIAINPLLKKGELVKAGTEMLRIDEADYLLTLESSQAEQQLAQALLVELEQTETNLQATKTLIEQKLALTKQELTRFEKLRKQNAVSQSALDLTHNSYLKQQQELISTNNALALIPSKRETAQARVQAAKSAVAMAERNLSHSRLILPYDARISEVYVEKNQFVRTGASLFAAHAINQFEIEMQLPLEQFIHFLLPAKGQPINLDNTSMHKMLEILELQARVTLIGGPPEAKWQGKIERISDTLNPHSQTLGVIVTVDAPYQKAKPGVRPPLLEGMYMRVELLGKPAPYLLLPRKALHQGELYMLTDDNRLDRHKLTDYLLAGEVIMVKSLELNGRRIITSDLFPAVNGMLVEPQDNPLTQQQLQQFAHGEAPIR